MAIIDCIRAMYVAGAVAIEKSGRKTFQFIKWSYPDAHSIVIVVV